MAEQGPLSGQILGGKYLLGELLGEGSFGTVYAGQHLRLGRPQAIKLLQERYFRLPKFRERFLREAQMIAFLDHPHIVHIDDFEIEEARAYLVMPFMRGGTFHSVLKEGRTQQRPLDVEQVVFYAEQISSALEYAHQRGVIHLDLKPKNLLVHDDGRLLLADFGLAHLIKSEGPEGGSSLGYGTPHYMAPEHIQGHPEKRSDVYAFGVMLYQMLAGRRPFEGEGVTVIMKHLTEPAPPLQTWRKDVPLELEGVLERALAKDPAYRYQSAGELLEAFKEALVQARERVRKTEEEGMRQAKERVRKTEEKGMRQDKEQARQPSDKPVPLGGRSEVVPIKTAPPTRKSSSSKRTLLPLWVYLVSIVIIMVGIVTSIRMIVTAQANLNVTATAQANLNVTATAQSDLDAATATVVAANPDPYLPTQGGLVVYDPLSQPDDHWSNNSDNSFGGAAQFTQGAYHLSQSKPNSFYYSESSDSYSNFALEVQMTITKGDCGGIVFRSDTKGANYFFVICHDGSYGLYLYLDSSGKNTRTLRSGSTRAMHTGYNQANVIAVVANGNSLDLYVNTQKIDSANDATYSSGIISLCADEYNSSTEVIYSNEKVWTF